MLRHQRITTVNRSFYTFWKNATADGSAIDCKNRQSTHKTRVKIADLQNFERVPRSQADRNSAIHFSCFSMSPVRHSSETCPKTQQSHTWSLDPLLSRASPCSSRVLQAIFRLIPFIDASRQTFVRSLNLLFSEQLHLC